MNNDRKIIFKELLIGFIFAPFLLSCIVLIVIEIFNIHNDIFINILIGLALLFYAYFFYLKNKRK